VNPARRSKYASRGPSAASTTSVINVAMLDIAYSPAPAAVPIAALT